MLHFMSQVEDVSIRKPVLEIKSTGKRDKDSMYVSLSTLKSSTVLELKLNFINMHEPLIK